MGFVLTAEWEKATGGPGGVTLAQLNEVTERATQECIRQGIDPANVAPKVTTRINGQMKTISISV